LSVVKVPSNSGDS